MNKKNIVIIPARGGSKRIPKKNIRLFLGRPIIEYSIQAAKEAGIFDAVVVSTDDPEIALVAKGAGASVPFLRSQKNSDDYATTVDVLLEVLTELSKLGETFDFLCCLYPTAPFVTAEKLLLARQELEKSQHETLIPVVRFSYPIQRALQIRDNHLFLADPKHKNTRSQDLRPHYHDCGQFYFTKISKLIEEKSFFHESVLPWILPESEVQDIDTLDDWELAELKFQLTLNLKKNVPR